MQVRQRGLWTSSELCPEMLQCSDCGSRLSTVTGKWDGIELVHCYASDVRVGSGQHDAALGEVVCVSIRCAYRQASLVAEVCALVSD